jgi:hypothetical protein
VNTCFSNAGSALTVRSRQLAVRDFELRRALGDSLLQSLVQQTDLGCLPSRLRNVAQRGGKARTGQRRDLRDRQLDENLAAIAAARRHLQALA